MRIVLTILSALVIAMSATAQNLNAAYEAYIDKYHKEAQQQQKKYGIPASITLAQGLLESGAGKSELATQANNHFGVKCPGGWTGDTYHHDDDAQSECFRKYKHAGDSYEDHSLFLQKPRYQKLFELDPTDYKGWAHGLKQCGYATDPGYATKLIKIIEDYDLTRFDNTSKRTHNQTDNQTNNLSPISADTETADNWNRSVDQPFEKATEAAPTEHSAHNAGNRRQMGSVALNQEHKVLRNNGRKYVVARLGETFADIAYEYNMYERTLRRYNDIVNPRYELQAGDKVYLQLKRKKAEKKYARYRVRGDENIWQIAQDKGMRLNTIYKLNGIEQGQNVMRNQDLILR